MNIKSKYMYFYGEFEIFYLKYTFCLSAEVILDFRVQLIE